MKELALTLLPILGIVAFFALVISVAAGRHTSEYVPGNAASIPKQRDGQGGGQA